MRIVENVCGEGCLTVIEGRWWWLLAMKIVDRPPRRPGRGCLVTWRPEPQPACEPGCTCGTPIREYLTATERAMLWPDAPAETFGQWIERIDPAPVEPPPLPPAPESSYPPDAVDLPVQYANVSLIRRILNATNRKSSS